MRPKEAAVNEMTRARMIAILRLSLLVIAMGVVLEDWLLRYGTQW